MRSPIVEQLVNRISQNLLSEDVEIDWDRRYGDIGFPGIGGGGSNGTPNGSGKPWHGPPPKPTPNGSKPSGGGGQPPKPKPKPNMDDLLDMLGDNLPQDIIRDILDDIEDLDDETDMTPFFTPELLDDLTFIPQTEPKPTSNYNYGPMIDLSGLEVADTTVPAAGAGALAAFLYALWVASGAGAG